MAQDAGTLTSGMTLDQYQQYLQALMAQRGSGFYDPADFFQAADPNALTNQQTLGYNPLTGFNYTNEFGDKGIFTPTNVINVEAERTLAERTMAEQQAAQEAAAAAAANKPGIGSQIAYGALGAVTGIPGSLIQAGANALGNLGGQTVVEGGTLPAYYTIGSPTGYVNAAGESLNPDTGLPYGGTSVINVAGGGGGGGVPATVTGTQAPATSTASTTTTGTVTGTGEGPGEIQVMDPFQVSGGGGLPTATFGGGLTGIGTGGTAITGGGGGGGTTGTGGVIQMPGVTVTDTNLSNKVGGQYNMLLTNAGYVYDPATGKYTMPAVKADTGGGTTTTSTISTSNTPLNFSGFANKPAVGPFPATSQPSTSTASTKTTSTSTGTLTGTTGTGENLNLGELTGAATNIGVGAASRNFPAELAASTAALRANQGNIMGMYGDIYQNLLGQTAIPQAAQQSLAQMQADAAKLQRIQSGQLAAEDVRNAQQAAREAYGARGQVMGPGAIGAEILNREAIRQQREDQARAGYQASMGNVFNAAQLQTGNIFNPISNLVSGTFNPLGVYPQDVYSSNVNAQLARDISAANNAAAIEAAKYGAAASQKAATTGALAGIFGKIAGNIDWSKYF